MAECFSHRSVMKWGNRANKLNKRQKIRLECRQVIQWCQQQWWVCKKQARGRKRWREQKLVSEPFEGGKTRTRWQKLDPECVNLGHLEIDNAPGQCLTGQPSIMFKLVCQGDQSSFNGCTCFHKTYNANICIQMHVQQHFWKKLGRQSKEKSWEGVG